MSEEDKALGNTSDSTGFRTKVNNIYRERDIIATNIYTKTKGLPRKKSVFFLKASAALMFLMKKKLCLGEQAP